MILILLYVGTSLTSNAFIKHGNGHCRAYTILWFDFPFNSSQSLVQHACVFEIVTGMLLEFFIP